MPSKLCSLDPDRTKLFGKYSPSTKFTLFTIKEVFWKQVKPEVVGEWWTYCLDIIMEWALIRKLITVPALKIVRRKISWIVSSQFPVFSCHLFFKHCSHHYQSDIQAHQQTYKCQLWKLISTTNIPLWAYELSTHVCVIFILFVLLSDPGPIIVYPWQYLTHSLTTLL